MTWKVWIHSILAAAIGAFATGATTVLTSPATFNFSHAGLINLAQVCGISALIAVMAVLKQSPLPPDASTPSASKLPAAAIALVFCSFMLSGCTPQEAQQTTVEITSALGTALTTLLDVEGNTVAAAQIKTDFAKLQTAETGWVKGSPAQDVIEALDLVQADVNLLPVSVEDTAFIDLAIGLTDQLAAAFGVTDPAAATVSPAIFVGNARLLRTHYAKRRHVKLAKPVTSAKDFKKRWNALVKLHPKLAAAKQK